MKTDNLKRILALFLVLTFMASMAVIAGAADDGDIGTDPADTPTETLPTPPTPTTTETTPPTPPTPTTTETTPPAQKTVTISAVEGTGIELTAGSGTITLDNRNAELKATVDPADGDYSCEWSSDATDVMTVGRSDMTGGQNDKGEKATLKPVKVGTAKIKVIVKNGETTLGEVECTITVNYAPITDITISGSEIVKMDPGSTTELRYTTAPELRYTQGLIWTSEKPSVATVEGGVVTAIKPGTTRIKAEPINGTAAAVTWELSVSGIVIKEVRESGESVESETITVHENAFVNISYTPYGDAAENTGVNASVRWTTREPLFATVEGSGNPVKLTGKKVGNTVLTLNVTNGGKSYYASCNVVVDVNKASVVESTVSAGGYFAFSSVLDGDTNSLKYSCSESTGGGVLHHINNLHVSTQDGILYYNYVPTESSGVGVATTDVYYVTNGERLINDLSFVPKPECSSVVNITYTGYNEDGESYNGTIRLTVSGIAGVGYTTDVGREVKFDAADFSKVCSETTGRGLEYLSFELPAATRGILQYNYGALGQYSEPVEAGKNYYYSKDPRISSVSFIPAEGFVGSARIKYNAVNTAGSRYSGYVTIQVFDNSTTAGDINYTCPGGQPVKMVAGDFDDLCAQAVKGTLDYVRFKLPESSQGVLRYTNEKNTSFSTTVNEYTRYYLTSPSSGSGIRPVIGNVSFVPAEDFTGTAYMSFTGYSTDGKSFTGTIRVLKEENSGDMIINYSSTYGTAVNFNAADFNERCLELYGEVLDHVTFELPDSSLGTLYTYYNASYGTGSTVGANQQFSRTSISNVTFVPKRGYSGDVNIVFTGETVPATGATSGEKIGGTVRISVTGNQERVIYYNVVKGGVVNFNAADFNSVCLTYTGQNLNYVRFTESPAYNRGSLGYDYSWDNERFASSVYSGSSYYRTAQTYYSNQLIDKVGYKAPDNYTGTLSLEYSGWSTSNVMFKGVMQIRIRDAVADPIVYSCGAEPLNMKGDDFRNACKNLMNRELSQISFTSLPSGDTTGRLYYSYSNPAQRGSEVTTGSTYNASGVPGIDSFTFVPKANASGRAILSYSATDVKGKSFTGSVYIDIANRGSNNRFNDMGSYGWAQPSVSFLTNYNIVTGQTNYQYGPQNPIKRGDFVLLLCRAFRLNTGTRPGFSDVPEDSYYAWAIATASDLGIAQGDGGRFRPEDTLTREDAMVLVQRTMRAAGMSAPDGSEEYLRQFADGGSVSGYARGGVAMMIQMGLVTGSNNLINPHSSISRAEMAVLVHRVLTK